MSELREPGRGRRPAILVVDDRPENLEAFRRILSGLDADTVTAGSGTEALARVLEREYAFVLLDVRMPGMDGFELARILKGDPDTRHLPILFVTADSFLDTKLLEGYDIGALDFIIKPVDPGVLLGKARILLGLYAYHKERVGSTELRYRALFEGMSEPVLVCGLGSAGRRQVPVLLEANAAACEALGRRAGIAEGTPLDHLLPGIEERHVEALAALAAEGADFPPERVRLRGGAVYKLSAHAPSSGFVVILLDDLSAEAETERRLGEAKALAEEAAAAKQRFLSNMSHEIRTPLNGIRGMAELLGTTMLTQEQSRYLQNLAISADILLDLVNDVLDLSRIEAGRWPGKIERFDLGEVCAKAAEVCAAGRRGKPIEISVDTSGLEAGQGLVRGDRQAVERVLVNLAGNAMKFTESGRVTIAARREPRVGWYALSVRDTGVGIPAGKLDSLFQRFSQLDSGYAKRFGGTGLGLSICKELADRLGGAVEVVSEVSRGSTFTLRLPLEPAGIDPDAKPAAAPGAPIPAAVAAGREGEEPAPCPRLSVLLAEDNGINALLARTVLERDGHMVDWAANGALAVERAAVAAYDIVLMDVQMPVMDGFEATRRLRSAGFAGPIVALTGYTFAEDLRRCKSAGMDAYLAKPVSGDALLNLVRDCRPRPGSAALAPPGRFEIPEAGD